MSNKGQFGTAARKPYDFKGDGERVDCKTCDFGYYPQNKIVVVVVATYGDEVLLCRRAKKPARGRWALPGGHENQGEGPVETALRETKEETGLTVNIKGVLGLFWPNDGPNDPNELTIMLRAEIPESELPNLAAKDETSEVILIKPEDIGKYIDSGKEYAFPFVAHAIHLLGENKEPSPIVRERWTEGSNNDNPRAVILPTKTRYVQTPLF